MNFLIQKHVITIGVIFLKLSCLEAFIDQSTISSHVCSNDNDPGRPEKICIGKFHHQSKIEWIIVGEKISGPGDIIPGLWDSISIQVTSKTNFVVWAYGGTANEPRKLQGWNRKYCWGDGAESLLNTFGGVNKCEFTVPRYSMWAPLGRSIIGIQPINGFLTHHSQSSMNTSYALEYNTKFDRSYPIYLILGLVIFLAAPHLSHSNVFYMSTATLLGGVGSFIVLLYLISRIFPGKRKTTMFAGMVGLSSIAIQFFWNSFKQAIVEYMYFVSIFIMVGAFIGFSVAYTHPLKSSKKRNLLHIMLCMISLFFILHGTNSLVVSAIIFFGLLCSQKLHSCLFYQKVTKRKDYSKMDLLTGKYQMEHHRNNIFPANAQTQTCPPPPYQDTRTHDIYKTMKVFCKLGDTIEIKRSNGNWQKAKIHKIDTNRGLYTCRFGQDQKLVPIDPAEGQWREYTVREVKYDNATMRIAEGGRNITMSAMTINDVVLWFKLLDLPEAAESCKNNKITGIRLAGVDKSCWEAIGIPSRKHGPFKLALSKLKRDGFYTGEHKI